MKDIKKTIFCPLCRHAMAYDALTQTYRCEKTDFHRGINTVITTGLTRFRGIVIKNNEDINESFVLLIMRQGELDSQGLIKNSMITVHEEPEISSRMIE